MKVIMQKAKAAGLTKTIDGYLISKPITLKVNGITSLTGLGAVTAIEDTEHCRDIAQKAVESFIDGRGRQPVAMTSGNGLWTVEIDLYRG